MSTLVSLNSEPFPISKRIGCLLESPLAKATFTCPFSLRHPDHEYTTSFLGGGQSFVSVSPSVGHASISFVCQQGVFKALSPRLLTLSWCGAGSPAVLPSEFASPALCSQSAEFPTTPGKSRRYIVKFRHASSIATSLMGYPSSKLSNACLAQPLHSPPSWLAPDT